MADNFLSGVGNFINSGVRALQPGVVRQQESQQNQQSFENEFKLFTASPTEEAWANLQQHPVFKDFTNRQQSKMASIRSAKDVNAAANALKSIDTAESLALSSLPLGQTDLSPKRRAVYDSLRESIVEPFQGSRRGQAGPTSLEQTADKASAFLSEDFSQAGPTSLEQTADKASAFLSEDFSEPEPRINPKTGKPTRIFSPKGKVEGTVNADESISYFDAAKTEGKVRSADFFQVSTPDVPKEDLPKTYEDIGVDSPQDIQTLQEIQKIAPDVDMKEEYRKDSEYMKKIMDGWRKGLIKNHQLRDAFSSMQQTAKESLGIA